MNRFKLVLLAVVTLALGACTGAGTRGVDAISSSLRTANPDAVFVYRDTGFSGSGALMKAFLNGEDMGNVGIKESLEFEAPKGENVLEIRYTGLAALNEAGKLTFVNDGKTPSYFIVSQKQNLLGATIQVIETTEQSYLAQVN